MQIVKENGDLVKMFKEGKFDGIAHGCNCFHAMNSGIAKTIREEFIEAYKADLHSNYGDPSKLGGFTIGETNYGAIFNLYTQNYPGAQKDVEQLYRNIESSFRYLNNYIGVKKRIWDRDKYILGIPKIGAGIAGGEWNKIEPLITLLTQVEVHVINFVPDAVDLFSLG